MYYNYRIENRAYEEPAAILCTSATRKKRTFRLPRSGCLGTPLTLPQSLYGRTLTSEPKFFGSTGLYQICLPMELRYKHNETSNTTIFTNKSTFFSIAQLVQIKLLNNISNRPLLQQGKKSL